MGDTGRCFTIKSSDLFATFKHKKQKEASSNWTYEFHDFKKQHEILANIIRRRDIFDILPVLKRIIETGKYRDAQNTVTFHPDVIKQLEGILS